MKMLLTNSAYYSKMAEKQNTENGRSSTAAQFRECAVGESTYWKVLQVAREWIL